MSDDPFTRVPSLLDTTNRRVPHLRGSQGATGQTCSRMRARDPPAGSRRAAKANPPSRLLPCVAMGKVGHSGVPPPGRAAREGPRRRRGPSAEQGEQLETVAIVDDQRASEVIQGSQEAAP